MSMYVDSVDLMCMYFPHWKRGERSSCFECMRVNIEIFKCEFECECECVRSYECVCKYMDGCMDGWYTYYVHVHIHDCTEHFVNVYMYERLCRWSLAILWKNSFYLHVVLPAGCQFAQYKHKRLHKCICVCGSSTWIFGCDAAAHRIRFGF